MSHLDNPNCMNCESFGLIDKQPSCNSGFTKGLNCDGACYEPLSDLLELEAYRETGLSPIEVLELAEAQQQGDS